MNDLRNRFFATALAALVCLCGGGRPAAVQVEFSPYTTKVKKFDRAHRPKEIGGTDGSMVGVTVWGSSVNYGFGYTFTSATTADGPIVRLKPTSIKITADCSATIWLPSDCGQDLVQHENGHAKLVEFVYKRLASRAGAFGQSLLSMTFEGKSEDDAKAKFDAYFVKQCRQPYFDLLTKVSDDFDKLTAHGTNHAITADAAVNQVEAQSR